MVRLNRLFWSDGQAGIDAFSAQVARYTASGFEVELQVRYHPPSGQAGDIPAWLAYVSHVVDSFGTNPRVVSMTITNEVNVTFSPNTSDGAYSRAPDALSQGIEAAHDEALRKHFVQLRFGFTYAYRFSPQGDAAFFSISAPTEGWRSSVRSASSASTSIPARSIPRRWFPATRTRPSSPRSPAWCATAMPRRRESAPASPSGSRERRAHRSAVGGPAGGGAHRARACRLHVLGHVQHHRLPVVQPPRREFEWTSTLIGPTFSSFGLLRDDYSAKPSFAAYRSLIGACGARTTPAASRRSPAGSHRRRRHHRRVRSRRTRRVRLTG